MQRWVCRYCGHRFSGIYACTIDGDGVACPRCQRATGAINVARIAAVAWDLPDPDDPRCPCLGCVTERAVYGGVLILDPCDIRCYGAAEAERLCTEGIV